MVYNLPMLVATMGHNLGPCGCDCPRRRNLGGRFKKCRRHVIFLLFDERRKSEVSFFLFFFCLRRFFFGPPHVLPCSPHSNLQDWTKKNMSKNIQKLPCLIMYLVRVLRSTICRRLSVLAIERGLVSMLRPPLRLYLGLFTKISPKNVRPFEQFPKIRLRIWMGRWASPGGFQQKKTHGRTTIFRRDINRPLMPHAFVHLAQTKTARFSHFYPI